MQRNLIVIGSGFLLGIFIGFYMGWFALPAELVDVTPADLEPEFQDDYLQLIASTYAADQDIEEAADRIGSLGREDWPDWLLQTTIDKILLDPADDETVHMVQLSRAMGLENPAFDRVDLPNTEAVTP